jgi:hypothetical protein
VSLELTPYTLVEPALRMCSMPPDDTLATVVSATDQVMLAFETALPLD